MNRTKYITQIFTNSTDFPRDISQRGRANQRRLTMHGLEYQWNIVRETVLPEKGIFQYLHLMTVCKLLEFPPCCPGPRNVTVKKRRWPPTFIYIFIYPINHWRLHCFIFMVKAGSYDRRVCSACLEIFVLFSRKSFQHTNTMSLIMLMHSNTFRKTNLHRLKRPININHSGLLSEDYD